MPIDCGGGCSGVGSSTYRPSLCWRSQSVRTGAGCCQVAASSLGTGLALQAASPHWRRPTHFGFSRSGSSPVHQSLFLFHLSTAGFPHSADHSRLHLSLWQSLLSSYYPQSAPTRPPRPRRDCHDSEQRRRLRAWRIPSPDKTHLRQHRPERTTEAGATSSPPPPRRHEVLSQHPV
jgi:hypothetical protein